MHTNETGAAGTDGDDVNGNIAEPPAPSVPPLPDVALPEPVQRWLSAYAEPVRRWFAELARVLPLLQRRLEGIEVRLGVLEGTVDEFLHDEAPNGQPLELEQFGHVRKRIDMLEERLGALEHGRAGALPVHGEPIEDEAPPLLEAPADRTSSDEARSAPATSHDAPSVGVLRAPPLPQLPIGWQAWRDELEELPPPPVGRGLAVAEADRIRLCMLRVRKQYDHVTLVEFQTFLAQYYGIGVPQVAAYWAWCQGKLAPAFVARIIGAVPREDTEERIALHDELAVLCNVSHDHIAAWTVNGNRKRDR